MYNLGDYYVCDLPMSGPAYVFRLVAYNTYPGSFWGEMVWCDFSLEYDKDFVYLFNDDHTMQRISDQQFVEIKLCNPTYE